MLRENLDLRDTLKEKDLLDENTLKDLRDLYSVFGDSEESSQEEDKDESK